MADSVLARPPARPRRLVYLGTPEVAVEPLRALVEAGFDIALVVSGPDKRRGRGGQRTATPVKSAALELGLPVTDVLDDVSNIDVDLGVVVAYGRLIPEALLHRVPMINIHFSLLPRWRGAAPVERALLEGDEVTGVCLMDIGVELDVGDVYARASTLIAEDDTLDSLRSRLVTLGSSMLVETLQQGLPDPIPQSGEVTYAKKIASEDLRIDWDAPASLVDRQVRLGGAWTEFRGARFKVHEARIVGGSGGPPGSLHGLAVDCGEGALELVVVQTEGKPRQAADAWRNGARPTAEDRFGR